MSGTLQLIGKRYNDVPWIKPWLYIVDSGMRDQAIAHDTVIKYIDYALEQQVDDWIEIDEGEAIIKTYIIAPHRTDISIRIMTEEMSSDSDLTASEIIDRKKTYFMNSNTYKEGDFGEKLDVKIGDNIWGSLLYIEQKDRYEIYQISFVTVKEGTIVHITFTTFSRTAPASANTAFAFSKHCFVSASILSFTISPLAGSTGI